MKTFKPVKSILVILISLLFVCAIGFTSYANTIEPDLEHVLQAAAPGENISVIVTLTDKVDLTQFESMDKGLLRAMIIRALKSKADLTQIPVQAFLRAKGAQRIVTLWLINGMAVTAPSHVIRELATMPLVESIRLDDTLKAPVSEQSISSIPEWNINAVGAPQLWDLGHRGEGAVVASMDTGVDVNHPDLSGKWRGGINSWYDPNGEHSIPYDSDGHGTQTMGIIVGGDNGGTSIGVAPGAEWIAVKIFNDAGFAYFSGIHQGFQWLLDPDGNPDTNDSPDVVNNSWGLKNNVNECVLEFQDDIQALKAAEIAVAFAAGNAGPGSSTSISPANYPESFAVGAISDTFLIASFSSRGPSTCDGAIYPETVAPGVNIKTSDLTFGGVIPNSYAYVSGTSFSAPHVAGSMALLLGAFPNLPVSELETALKQSAIDLGTAGPDNSYGYGLIDAMEAYNLINGSVTCTDADNDGYYVEEGCGTAQDCNDSNPSIHPSASEVKHDGVDQDCNGYDLTIDILNAIYGAKKDSLGVEATSDLGQKANLELAGYGTMKWDRKKLKWTISLNRVGGNPGTITVSGTEGSESATTTVK
ncbi:MAG: S8 family serine peptidase [Nitrospirota bacterium]